MLPLLSALVLAAPPCGPLDLPSVLALAAERSDEVSIQQAEALGAQADIAIAKAAGILAGSSAQLIFGPAPAAHGTVVDAGTYNNRQPFRDLAPFGRLDITATQPIYTWGQWSSAQDAAKAGAAARALLVQATRNRVQHRAVQLYWGVALAKRLLQISKEVESALNDAEKKVDESLASGKGDVEQADRFRLRVFRGELLARRADAQKGLRLARLALAGTLAIEEPSLVLRDELLPPEVDANLPDLGLVVSAAAERRPDLLALDQGLRAKEAEVRADIAARLPAIFIGGELALSYAPNRTIQTNPWVSDFFNTVSAGIALGFRESLQFPLMNAQLEKARAGLFELRRQREGLLRLVRVEAESGVAELQAAEDRWTAAKGALSAGKGWFRSTGLTFGLGVSDAKGLIESYTGYVQTQVNESQAKFDVLVARAHLDVLMGKALSEGGSTCELR
jgi:outer membrane protein TolC